MAVILALGLANAGTVTLTGTCNKTSNVNVVNFTLSNSGNDTAESLLLSPMFVSASPANRTYALSALGPSQSHLFTLPLSNVTANGGYTDYFILSYEQGTSAFTAVFLCSLDFGAAPASQLYVTTNVTQGTGSDLVNVSVFNGGASAIDSNVTLVIPPAFLYLSSVSSSVRIGPYQTAHVAFNLSLPSSGQEFYQGGAVASYTSNGEHYSSLEIFTLSDLPQSAQTIATTSGSFTVPAYSLPWIAAGVVIAVIVGLIQRTRRNRKRAQQQAQV